MLLPKSLRYACLQFWAITHLLGIQAAPAYNPQDPPLAENFDPAEANPKSNITCLGDRYSLHLPVINGFDPNTVNMQTLCAKPQYGGGKVDQHVGGWCVPTTRRVAGELDLAEVGFDLSDEARVNQQLASPRLLLGCFYRCFCNPDGVEQSVQPRMNYPYFDTTQRRSVNTYEISVDVINDFDSAPIPHPGTRGQKRVPSVNILNLEQVSDQLGSPQPGPLMPITPSMNKANEISCRGYVCLKSCFSSCAS